MSMGEVMLWDMETLVLLHGFAGTHHSWAEVSAALPAQTYRPLAPDIPGHGTAGEERPIEWDTCVAAVLAQAPGRFALAGYSMGGRLALHVALAAPERVSRLSLIATTAGIADDAERAARRADDEALAAWMEQHDIEAFADRWCAQPMFAADPPQIGAFARSEILRNDPAGLAAALRGIGTGTMTPLWARLHELEMPAVVLTGERDVKFCAIGRELAERLPDATLSTIPGAGHGLLRETPAGVAAALAGVS